MRAATGARSSRDKYIPRLFRVLRNALLLIYSTLIRDPKALLATGTNTRLAYTAKVYPRNVF